MLKRSILLTVLVGLMAPGALADAILTYEPDTLDIGVPTVVTVSVSDSGAGFGLGLVNLGFVPPVGLSISDFGWQSGLGNPSLYFASEVLNFPYTIVLTSGSGVMVPSEPSAIPMYQITVTILDGADIGQKFELPSNPLIKEHVYFTVVPYIIEDGDGQPIPHMGFWVIPEPATVAMLVVGGLFGLRRRP